MIPHGPARCDNICCSEVPSSWVLLNSGVNVSFLDPPPSFLTHHTQVSKATFCARHWLHARHRLWSLHVPWSAPALPWPSPGRGWAGVSLTKKAQLVCEVITLPHFLTWPCVTWMPLYPHFGYCYFSLIKNKWGWSVFTYPTISGCSYTVPQNGFWPPSLKPKRSLAGVHTSDFHRLLVHSCPST